MTAKPFDYLLPVRQRDADVAALAQTMASRPLKPPALGARDAEPVSAAQREARAAAKRAPRVALNDDLDASG